MARPLVVIGILGSVLDEAGKGPNRWNRWRPTVAMCRHENLPISRLELISQERFSDLFERVVEDIATVSPRPR